MAEMWYYKQLREYEQKIKKQEKELEENARELKEKERKIRELEEKLRKMAESKSSKKPKFANVNYSLKTQTDKRKHWVLTHAQRYKNVWRKKKIDKIAGLRDEISRTVNIYSEWVDQNKCSFIYTRLITHLVNGDKEVVLYRIYRENWSEKKSNNQKASKDNSKWNKIWKIPWVLPNSEYWIEIPIALSFFIYWLQLSTDQARQVLEFCCKIEIQNSEIDSLLYQLSNHLHEDFNTICDIILLSLIVHIDETWWKISKDNCYAWIFKTLSHTVLLFWEKRNEDVLDRILPKGEFKWIPITDCFSVYNKYFDDDKHQTCWAHYLRDAIKLMLLHPDNKNYSTFFEDLLQIFLDWKKLKVEFESDENKIKFNNEYRFNEVSKLNDRVTALCNESETELNKETPKDFRNFVNLQKRIIKKQKWLFLYVTNKNVDPTNNKAEQWFRNTSKSRNNYQTSKTKKWADRRSVITTVLESLKQNLPTFTLESMTSEIKSWMDTWESLFKIQLKHMQLWLSS